MSETLNDDQRWAIDEFLEKQRASGKLTSDQYWESYQNWWRGGRGWWPLHQGGTGQMTALMWYQHIHKPGSKEWRPKIIISELLKQVEEQI